jgi:hypothetical protein
MKMKIRRDDDVGVVVGEDEDSPRSDAGKAEVAGEDGGRCFLVVASRKIQGSIRELHHSLLIGESIRYTPKLRYTPGSNRLFQRGNTQ